MKRLRVMQFLCCLSLMLCVTCSEVFLIKASAADFDVNALQWTMLPFNYFLEGQVEGSFDNVSNTYNANSSTLLNTDTYITYMVGYSEGSSFPVIESGHTYLFYYNISFPNSSAFSVLDMGFEEMSYVGKNHLLETSNLDAGIASTSGIFKFTATNSFSMNTASSVIFNLNINFNSTGRQIWAFYLLDITNNSENEVNSIISAINNQTSQLGSAIGDAADQVTDKIDEVLTPDGEHNFDSVIDNVNDKINENMGALGFAHDTVAQFADLFTETPGAPVITVPPLKMSIKGQEYEFFHGYQYDFRSMETGALGVLVTAVRTTGTIVLWLAFLSYCSKEFNNFFRR